MQRKVWLAGAFALLCVVLAANAVIRVATDNSLEGDEEELAAERSSFFEQFNLEDLTIPGDEILRGGPPKDGIPAITDPDVAAIDEVDFLEPDDRVVGVTIEGESRAYPIRLLNWHEAVNDRFGETPFAVVYCPLCDSVSVFDRRVEGEVLEFGISGLLYNSNVLLYDRTYDALWSQVAFEAVSGPHAGQALKHLPFELTTFEAWREAQPDSTVATFETSHRRAYDRNPYEQYFAADGLMFPAKGGDDDRLGQKDVVVGVAAGDFVRAYPLERVAAAEGGRVEQDVNGERIVLEAVAEEGRLRVVEVPEEAQVIHTFWFAWVAFHPETTLFGGNDE